MQTKIYAGRLKDKDELLKSSSGGAFTAISNVFLNNGDAVVASIYDYSDDKLKFSIIFDKNTRNLARGSKYFQSSPDNIFKESKTWLGQHPDKKMLFVGTGCQAEAFRKFMESCELTSRVFTVDIICYGAVSPGLWRSYLQFNLRNLGNKTNYSDLTFKDKRDGWIHPSALFKIDSDEVSIEDYVKIFYSKNALRPSCYKCPYTKLERNTDITIGDFWGIDQRMPDFYDPMGNSLFLVHTLRGQALFDSICSEIDYRESNKEECMQSHLQDPTELPQDRAEFWKIYKQAGIQEVLKKYAADPVYKRTKGKVKSTLKKFLRK